MPVFGKKDPTDGQGLYEKIRGPSQEEIVNAVGEHVRAFFFLFCFYRFISVRRESVMLTDVH
jgi:hypothetical protein